MFYYTIQAENKIVRSETTFSDISSAIVWVRRKYKFYSNNLLKIPLFFNG